MRSTSERDVDSDFHPMWIRLCRHVHPSPTEMDVTAVADFSILVTDSFNEELAREAMKITDDVFDVVYTILLSRFPRMKEDARRSEFLDEWEKYMPNTVRTVKNEKA